MLLQIQRAIFHHPAGLLSDGIGFGLCFANIGRGTVLPCEGNRAKIQKGRSLFLRWHPYPLRPVGRSIEQRPCPFWLAHYRSKRRP